MEIKKTIYIFLFLSLSTLSFAQNNSYDINLIGKPTEIKNKHIMLNGKRVPTRKYRFELNTNSIITSLKNKLYGDTNIVNINKGIIVLDIYSIDNKTLNNDSNSCNMISFSWNPSRYGRIFTIQDKDSLYLIRIVKFKPQKVVIKNYKLLYSRQIIKIRFGDAINSGYLSEILKLNKYRSYYKDCHKIFFYFKCVERLIFI